MTVRKKMILLTMLAIVLLCTSCKEIEELQDIAIVIATGLDIDGEQVVLTVEVIIPLNRAEESGNSSSMILQEKGDTLMEAIRNVTLNFDRKLFFSHNAVIIFGEELAKEGIGKYLDFFTKDNEPREGAYMLVAKDSKAYELMGINDGLSSTGGEYLETLFDNTMLSLKSRSLTVNEFFKYYYDRKTPLLGIVEKTNIIDIEPVTGEIGNKAMLDIRGGAPFYKDKLVDYYNAEEMIGFNFLVDEVKQGIIVFEAPLELLEYSDIFSTIGNSTTFEIVKSKTKNTIEIIDGEINLNIDVNIRGLIVEDNRGLDTNILKIRDAVQDVCGDQVEEYISMAMDKAQELKTDSFGINHMFYAKYPKEYKKIEDEWGYEFSKIDYSIDVNVDIIRTGLTNTPVNIKKGEDY